MSHIPYYDEDWDLVLPPPGKAGHAEQVRIARFTAASSPYAHLWTRRAAPRERSRP